MRWEFIKSYKSLRKKPLNYPKDPQTIGRLILKRRMDLGLSQPQVAKIIGVSTNTITYWETGKSEPSVKYLPKIINFLQKIPFNLPSTVIEELKYRRLINGLSQKNLSKELKEDAKAIRMWELGKRRPTLKTCNRLKKKMLSLNHLPNI